MVWFLSNPQRSLDPMAPFMNGNVPRSARTGSSPVHCSLEQTCCTHVFNVSGLSVTLLPNTLHSQYTLRLGHFRSRITLFFLLLSVLFLYNMYVLDMDVHINPTLHQDRHFLRIFASSLAKICLLITITVIPYFSQDTWVPLNLNSLVSPSQCYSNDN